MLIQNAGMLLPPSIHQSPPQPGHFNQLVPPLPPAAHRISPLNQHRISPLPPLSVYPQSSIPMFQGPGLVNILPGQAGAGLTGTISPEILSGISPTSQSAINPLAMLRPLGPLHLSDAHALNALRSRIPTAGESGSSSTLQISQRPEAMSSLLQREIESSHLKLEESARSGTASALGNPAMNQTLEQMLKVGTNMEMFRNLAFAHSAGLGGLQEHTLKQSATKEHPKVPVVNSEFVNKSEDHFQQPMPPVKGGGPVTSKFIGSIDHPGDKNVRVSQLPQNNKALAVIEPSRTELNIRSQLEAHLTGKPSPGSATMKLVSQGNNSHISDGIKNGDRASPSTLHNTGRIKAQDSVGTQRSGSPYHTVHRSPQSNHRVSPYPNMSAVRPPGNVNRIKTDYGQTDVVVRNAVHQSPLKDNNRYDGKETHGQIKKLPAEAQRNRGSTAVNIQKLGWPKLMKEFESSSSGHSNENRTLHPQEKQIRINDGKQPQTLIKKEALPNQVTVVNQSFKSGKNSHQQSSNRVHIPQYGTVHNVVVTSSLMGSGSSSRPATTVTTQVHTRTIQSVPVPSKPSTVMNNVKQESASSSSVVSGKPNFLYGRQSFLGGKPVPVGVHHRENEMGKSATMPVDPSKVKVAGQQEQSRLMNVLQGVNPKDSASSTCTSMATASNRQRGEQSSSLRPSDVIGSSSDSCVNKDLSNRGLSSHFTPADYHKQNNNNNKQLDIKREGCERLSHAELVKRVSLVLL